MCVTALANSRDTLREMFMLCGIRGLSFAVNNVKYNLHTDRSSPLKKYLFALLLVAAVAGAPLTVNAQAQAQPEGFSNVSSKDAEYLALVEKAQASDSKAVDWSQLRNAYVQTSFYDPYGGAQAIWYSLQRAGMLVVATPSDENVRAYHDLLNKHYAHYRAHLQAIDLWNKTKTSVVNKSLHENAFREILRSIRLTGDGKSPETAFRVIDPAEESMILKTFHYRLIGQEFRQNNGQFWDVLKYVNPQVLGTDGKPVQQEMFFNVNVILQASGNR